jgi:hypothetical protein
MLPTCRPNFTEVCLHHIKGGAGLLCDHLQELIFLVSLVVACDVLFQTNVVRKSMQSQNFDVWKSVELNEGCHEFLNAYM